MIFSLSTDENYAGSLYYALPSHNSSLFGQDESFALHRFAKDLEGCEFDLEPLPLLSPPCLDILRPVSPSIFEANSYEDMRAPSSGTYLHSWLTSSSQVQSSADALTFASDVQGPSTYDVVCSRSKQHYHLPGCERFRQIVWASIPAYNKASSRRDKSAVIASIMRAVMDHPEGGPVRFLKYDNGSKTWTVLSSYQIRDKVGHALREAIQEMERAKRTKKYSIRQVVAPAS